MVGVRCDDFRTCADSLVSYSVPIVAGCRDCTRSRGPHRRPWHPRGRSGRSGRHADLRAGGRGFRWSRHPGLRAGGRGVRWSRHPGLRAGGRGFRWSRHPGLRARGRGVRWSRHPGLRAGGRGVRWSRRAALGSGRTAGGLLRADGSLGCARLSAWRLRTTDLGGGCGCRTCSRGSAGTSWSAMLCPRLDSRLRPKRRARLHRRSNLLPGRSRRSCRGNGCVRSTRCGWRRLRGRHPWLLHRRSSRATLRPLGLPSKPEPGQEALFGRWRRRRIPYGHGTLSRPGTGRRWRRRITKLRLSGGIRSLPAGLRLRSWLSRRRLRLLRLSRRRLRLLRLTCW